MFKKYIVLTSICLIFLVGCKTTETKLPVLEPLKLEKTEIYKLDDTSIKLPDKPVNMYGKISLSNKIDIVKSNENPDYVIFDKNEFSKVLALSDYAVGYKNIAKQQEELINTYVDKINSLKEMCEIERTVSISYNNLYNTQNELYKLEVKEHRKDKLIDRIVNIFTLIGSGLIIGSLL